MGLEYLWSLEKFGIKLGLENMKKALSEIKNPEKKLKVLHVGGTNGKGSVCAMLNSILTEAGYKVGMYTSPHLVRVNERIRIGSEEISDKELEEYINRLRRIKTELTFFEFLTLAAIQYFTDKEVDYAIIEVGMGGRLDATNVFDSKLTIITSLSLDHTDHLGMTLDDITREKAGILRKDTPLFTANFNRNNETLIHECKKRGAPLIICGLTETKTNMKGDFQKENAAIAEEASRYLGIKELHIKKGLMDVDWKGRAYHLKKNIIFDCAHNSDGIKAISEYIKGIKHEKLNIIFGCSKDKDYETMLKNLPRYDEIILTKSDYKPLELENYSIKAKKFEEPTKAYGYGISITGKKDILLITGSCYLVGNILEKISKTSASSL
ncbi:bifunctional folylpolyglutamate synthase/dihydrofolate synthase [Candidatus Woesearchaeota archaeon]|nr:bifunctional folylpolyglutamate synthase/dihydrofolate synthase [Candidatus Woesearchaeota archaeon]